MESHRICLAAPSGTSMGGGTGLSAGMSNGRAVGHDAGGAAQPELALLREVAVDLERMRTPTGTA